MERVPYVEEFLLWQGAAGRAEATLRNHKAGLRKFDRWLSGQDGKTAQTASAQDLAAFINEQRKRYAPDQVNLCVCALRVYFRWLAEEEVSEAGDNPARRLKFLAVPPRPVESLSKEQCRKLVRWAGKARKQRFGVHRTAVLALLLLDTGMRLGEALSLRVSDVSLRECKCVVRQSKTRTFRVVPFSMTARRHLQHYLLRRNQRLDSRGSTDALFVTEDGRSCSVGTTEKSFRNLAKTVGIPKLHPHLLRHTFATQSLLNGAPLPAVMRLGGWRKLSTVQRYTYMNDAVAAEVHSRTSP
ncbi:MAG: tyrosine-type recombinase/integrase, partial [Armatimonadota bacterium]